MISYRNEPTASSGVSWHVAFVAALVLCGVTSAQSTVLREPETPIPHGISIQGETFCDIDGDGDVDFLATDLKVNAAPPVTRFFLNDGNGHYVRGPVPLAVSNPTGRAFANVDNDPAAEMIVGSGSGFEIHKLIGGTFVSVATFGSLSPAPILWIVPADVDADGQTDLVFTFGPSPFSQAVLRNLGGNAFVPVLNALPTAVQGGSVRAAADFDGDGLVDLIYSVLPAPGFASRAQVVRNTGGGVFAPSGQMDLSHLGWSTGIGDFNGDGRADIAIGTAVNSGSPLTVITWSAGTLTTLFNGSLAANVVPVGALDVDGDGADEVVIGSSFPGPVAASGGAFAVTIAAMVLTFPFRVPAIVADLDGDGLRDIATRAVKSETVHIEVNSGVGTFNDLDAGTSGGLPLLFQPLTTKVFAFADAEGDGDVDVIARVHPPAAGVGIFTLALARNDGAGTFQLANPNPVVPANPPPSLAVMVPGDFDGDGRIDVSVFSSSTPVPAILASDSNGDFSRMTTNAPVTNVVAQAAADFDNDGRLDIAVAHAGAASQFEILLNQGGGTFTVASSVTNPTNTSAVAIVAVDLDNDGRKDLAAFTDNPPTVRVCRNTMVGGVGGFTLGPQVSIAAPTTGYTITAGDVDGDGDMDLIAGDSVLVNNGNLAFTVAGVLTTLTAQTNDGWALADIDGDGLADALGAREWKRSLGAGTFAPSEGVVNGTTTVSALIPVDYDGDGDLDPFCDRGYFITNMTRHLGHGDLPRVGRITTLEIVGPPTAPWLLVPTTGLLSPSQVISPWGRLAIDLATAITTVTGNLDANGNTTITALVPPVPALAGATVHWQAAILSTQRLTPRETTTILGF